MKTSSATRRTSWSIEIVLEGCYSYPRALTQATATCPTMRSMTSTTARICWLNRYTRMPIPAIPASAALQMKPASRSEPTRSSRKPIWTPDKISTGRSPSRSGIRRICCASWINDESAASSGLKKSTPPPATPFSS